MGAEEVYCFLKKNKGWHTALKIANDLNINPTGVRRSLKILTRYDDIACEYRHTVQKHSNWKKPEEKTVTRRSRMAWMYKYKPR